jgi:hypothetical protein
MARGRGPFVDIWFILSIVIHTCWFKTSPIFSIRCYIIVFEFSNWLPEDSTLDQRVVTSLPILKYGYDHPDDYGRDIAPEMLLDKPHCPFKSDVFQRGEMFFSQSHASLPPYIPTSRLLIAISASDGRLPNLIKIFESMTDLAVPPPRRPSSPFKNTTKGLHKPSWKAWVQFRSLI